MFRTRVAAAIAGAALIATGCAAPSTTTTSSGGSAPATTAAPTPTPTPTQTVEIPATTEELVVKTQAAMKAATSVTMAGAFTSDGQANTVEAKGMLDGSLYQVKLGQDGATIDLIFAESQLFLKADESFWAESGADQAGAEYAGKWVQLNDELSAQLKDMTPGFLLGSMSDNFTADKLGPKVTRGSVGGQDVFIVISSKGAASGQFSIAADGTWLPVRYETTSKDSPGSMTFSEWNMAPAVKAPLDAIEMK
ncbi:MAG: hypothetical protein WCF12_05590 [Propionicimonas sp.]